MSDLSNPLFLLVQYHSTVLRLFLYKLGFYEQRTAYLFSYVDLNLLEDYLYLNKYFKRAF